MKEADPIEKAEKDFWKIIDEEKRRRDRKGGVVDDKGASEGGAMAQAELAANTTAQRVE